MPTAMVTAERTCLVSCVCSARVPVTVGQAGDRVVCPACGRSIDVPRFRDLERCTPATTSGDRRTGWDALRGLLFAGVTIAMVAALAAANVTGLGGGIFSQPLDDDMIRTAVRAAPIVDVHTAWQLLSRSGVQRPPTEEEIRLENFSQMAAGLSKVLWGVAGLGAAVALVCGAVLAARGRPTGNRT